MINAIGIYAVGTTSGGPVDPGIPDNAEFGGMKMLTSFAGPGLAGYLAEPQQIPGACFAFDMRSMECKDIYQRYRVESSMPNLTPGVQDDVVIACISSGLAVSVSPVYYKQYAYVTPFRKNETLISLYSDWQDDCTLVAGVNLTPIDVGDDYEIYNALLVGAGKIVFTMSHLSEAVLRENTFYIVDFTSPTSHTKIPVVVDLDFLGIDSGYSFRRYHGVTNAAFDYITGALGLKLRLYSESGAGEMLIKVNAETGEVLSSAFVADDGTSGVGRTPAALFGDITNGTFDYVERYEGSFKLASFDKTVPFTYGGTAISKWTFTDRYTASAPNYNMQYNGLEELYEFVNLESSASDKLIELGYAIENPLDSFGGSPSVIFEDMVPRVPTESVVTLSISNNDFGEILSYGYNVFQSYGAVSGPAGSSEIAQIIVFNFIPSNFKILLAGDHPKDYLVSVESSNIGEVFLGEDAVYEIDDGYTAWSWPMADLGGYDSASSDTVTFITMEIAE